MSNLSRTSSMPSTAAVGTSVSRVLASQYWSAVLASTSGSIFAIAANNGDAPDVSTVTPSLCAAMSRRPVRYQRALSADICGSPTMRTVAATISAPNSLRATLSVTKMTRTLSSVTRPARRCSVSAPNRLIGAIGSTIGMAPCDGSEQRAMRGRRRPQLYPRHRHRCVVRRKRKSALHRHHACRKSESLRRQCQVFQQPHPAPGAFPAGTDRRIQDGACGRQTALSNCSSPETAKAGCRAD